MRPLGIFRSSAWTPSVSIWSDSILNTSAAPAALKPDITVLTKPAEAIVTSSNTVASWRASGLGRRPQWLHAGSSLRLEPAPAVDVPAQQTPDSPPTPLHPTRTYHHLP